MVANVAGIVIGAIFAINGIWHWGKLLRRQGRVLKAQGVFVGSEDVMLRDPKVHSRAGRFRFTAANGRVYERTSAFSSFPGPKPGRRVTVVYDPLKPETTAERAGVHMFLLVAGGPIMIIVGVVAIVFNATML